MKLDDLHLGENALLAMDLLRKLVKEIEKPDIIYDGSVVELVNILEIAAHSSSRDIVQCAQQFLGFTDNMQLLFFKSVGVKLENIFASKILANAQKDLDEDAFADEQASANRLKWM